MKKSLLFLLLFSIFVGGNIHAQKEGVRMPSAPNNVKTQKTAKKGSSSKKGSKTPSKKTAKKKEPQVKAVSGTLNDVQYVDLGLPSGNKWAVMNLGADAVDDFGFIFTWGANLPEMDDLEPDNLAGIKVGEICGDPDYDASAFLLEGNWCTPTKEDYEELFEYCDLIFFDENGDLFGLNDNYTALLIGPNGNILAFPYIIYEDDDEIPHIIGEYWTSTPVYGTLDMSVMMSFFDTDAYFVNSARTEVGMIRPVYHKRK